MATLRYGSAPEPNGLSWVKAGDMKPSALKPSVLIVEDEIFVALDVERVLQDAGFSIVGMAADRAEAMQVVDGAKLAFVDVNLRDGPTGPMIACGLSDDHGATVVYLTANPSQIDPVATKAIGVLRKPFSEASLVAVANAAAEGRCPSNIDGFTSFLA